MKLRTKIIALLCACFLLLNIVDMVIPGTEAQVYENTVRLHILANDNGETCFYESGTDFTGLAGCSRDDATQTTVYEVAIAWESLEITPEEGVEFGLTFSVNSTSEEDFNNGGWKNVTLRNGGGVIGRNDWSKIPVITLG